MNAIESLRFHRFVPPRVHHEDVIGTRQIDPGASCVEAAQHYIWTFYRIRGEVPQGLLALRLRFGPVNAKKRRAS